MEERAATAATAATECTAECTTDRRDVVVYLFFSFLSQGHSDNTATFFRTLCSINDIINILAG